METDGYSEGTEYPMLYLKSVPLVKEKLQWGFNITCSLLPAKQMWSGSIQSTCGMGLTGAFVAPGPLSCLGYMQDAGKGLGLECMSVAGKWKHFCGRDQRELDGGVSAVKKYGHKALTCRKLDYVSSAAHRVTSVVFWITQPPEKFYLHRAVGSLPNTYATLDTKGTSV